MRPSSARRPCASRPIAEADRTVEHGKLIPADDVLAHMHEARSPLPTPLDTSVMVFARHSTVGGTVHHSAWPDLAVSEFHVLGTTP